MLLPQLNPVGSRILEPLTTSLQISHTSQTAIIIVVMNKLLRAMVNHFPLITLVILNSMPHLICLNCVMFFMFPPCLQIFYLYISFAKITMPPFILMLPSFASRISVWGRSFTMASVSVVSILFMVPFSLSLPLHNIFIPLPLMFHLLFGITVWGIHNSLYFIMSYINVLVSLYQILILSVVIV